MLKCEQLKVQGNPNNIPSLIINSLHKYKHYGECRKKIRISRIVFDKQILFLKTCKRKQTYIAPHTYGGKQTDGCNHTYTNKTETKHNNMSTQGIEHDLGTTHHMTVLHI